MTADRDTTRVVRSWLRADEHGSADRVLESVLSRLDMTPQRRLVWPPRRFAQMNKYAQAAIAAAAVLVVAIIGYNLLPGRGGVGGQPTPSPALTPAPTPTAAAVISAPPATEPPIPAAGPLTVGRHGVTLEGVHFTLAIANPGWVSNGLFGFDKGPITPTGGAFILWEHDADGIFADPCKEIEAPKVGPSAAEIAAAIASVPGTELVSGPTALTIGGKPAQEVIIRIPDVIPCPPNEFYLWYDDSLPDNARYATEPGFTIRVWIIEVDGKRVQLDGETYKGAAPAAGAELEAIVKSIKFE